MVMATGAYRIRCWSRYCGRGRRTGCMCSAIPECEEEHAVVDMEAGLDGVGVLWGGRADERGKSLESAHATDGKSCTGSECEHDSRDPVRGEAYP
jgi:hypothetical protein